VPVKLPKPTSGAGDLATKGVPESPERILGSYGFPAYPGMQHLCGQRGFLPGGASLHWDSFATSDPWQEVRARLGWRLGEHGYVESAEFIGWRLPDPRTPTRELELVPKGRASLADRCPNPPSGDTETVIVARRW
jgi:hypothetical protein